jgi:hypothetical protein
LGGEVRRPEILCYNYQTGITYEEEDIIFAIKLEWFSIGTIDLPKTFNLRKPQMWRSWIYM